MDSETAGRQAGPRSHACVSLSQHKLQILLDALKSGKPAPGMSKPFFDGAKQVYIVRVIEFQKRGLPHAHIVIKLSFGDGEDLFLYVSATLPVVNGTSSEEDRQYHYLVAKHMVGSRVSAQNTLCLDAAPVRSSTGTQERREFVHVWPRHESRVS